MSDQNANGAKPPREMYVYGVVVAGIAFIVLGAAIVFLVTVAKARPADIALVMGTIASPIVAIASAYFGIQVAGKAASDAGRAAAGAGDLVGKAADAAGNAAAAAGSAAAAAHAAVAQIGGSETAVS